VRTEAGCRRWMPGQELVTCSLPLPIPYIRPLPIPGQAIMDVLLDARRRSCRTTLQSGADTNPFWYTVR
jgi:hypothetical protein